MLQRTGAQPVRAGVRAASGSVTEAKTFR